MLEIEHVIKVVRLREKTKIIKYYNDNFEHR